MSEMLAVGISLVGLVSWAACASGVRIKSEYPYSKYWQPVFLRRGRAIAHAR